MSLTGIAKDFGVGPPVDPRLIGIKFDQDDYPWWVTSILTWIRMVNFVFSVWGKSSQAYRGQMEKILESGDPAEVYDLYKRAVTYMEFVASGGENVKE